MPTFNGWKNYQTWNVWLWTTNDEALYRVARNHKTWAEYRLAIRELGIIETPDGVAFNDSGLDLPALDRALKGSSR